ncbi:LPS export ABC transporter protein LptC [Dysgonomonas sp. PH5-45]|uniref:LPS export ABC transporter periplasmic protein LptC n=1 Tax=unclassified Dysgonomonas TaxID=2630389 RepID=UPI0024734DB7|nr:MULTISPECIES: LPS export ABC transporter periplasmic protein LptC [unclassified Dysgonomonas]MDH6355275.1 LPS export ABC transporter protein LptC [Dysgonomonas sp. PH5-45]MDH6388199.1 LPS export ABC transporter protein LptC [Dysgonomonas sp. PH5-37]
MILNRKNIKRLYIAALAGVAIFVFSACSEETKETVALKYNKETVPTIDTDSATILISDSGIVRYKLVAKTYQILDKASNPHWYFPDGAYLEQFDPFLRPQATVKADTAWNYTRQKYWRLKGHVHIKTIEGKELKTDELVWNVETRTISSDSYFEYLNPGETILKGIGFKTNEQMSWFSTSKPDGGYYYAPDDTENTAVNDTIQSR